LIQTGGKEHEKETHAIRSSKRERERPASGLGFLGRQVGEYGGGQRARGKRKEDRDFVIYALWEKGLFRNEEIGQVFGLSYSAVSHIVNEVRVRIEKDPRGGPKQWGLIHNSRCGARYTIRHRKMSFSSKGVFFSLDWCLLTGAPLIRARICTPQRSLPREDLTLSCGLYTMSSKSGAK